MKDLTGKGKPFHSLLDKGAALLKRKVGTGAEFMQELKGLGGIKQSEIDERKLGEVQGMPKMTHEQFVAELANRPMPAIQEKVLGEEPEPPSKEEIRRNANDLIRVRSRQYASEASDNSREYRTLLAEEMRRLRENHMDQAMRFVQEDFDKNPEATYHHQYTIPGGDNYREMLIKAPKGGEEFGGVKHHFGGEKNILASMRLKDRTGPNGEKLLHLEELQSDWHQKGREGGYGSRLTPEDEAKIADFEARQRHQANPVGEPLTIADRAEWAGLIKKREGAVPDAPFKKNWEEMALKRLIHHAAENGYHGIVVTPGAEQADRYSLSQQVDSLKWHPESNQLTGIKDGRAIFNQSDVNENNLANYVGKEAAQKLIESPKPKHGLANLMLHEISGDDLRVGGEGMKGFYDKKVPNILNSIGKKYGAKTELNGHTLQGRGRERSTSEFGQAIRDAGHNIHDLTLAQQQEFDYEPKPIPAHYFPITEDMRKDVLTNGLPLYAEGGIIHKAQGGTVLPSLEQMKFALMKQAKPNFNDMRNIGANEAPGMNIKAFVPPTRTQDGPFPVGGVSMGGEPLPMGGVDMSMGQQGNQLMPANLMAPQGGQPPQGQPPQGMPSPLGGQPPAPMGGSNILQMTQQGQALAAMKPPGMAHGGGVQNIQEPFMQHYNKPAPFMMKDGGSYDMPMDNQSMDNGATTFNIDDSQLYADGGGVMGYASKGYVTSTPMKPDPVVGTRFKATPQGNLVKRKPFDIMSMENKGSFVNLPYDATTRDNLVTEVSGHTLNNPLLTEAGFDYSMDPKHVKKGIGGASNLGIASRVKGRIDQAAQEHQGDVFLVPNTMSDSDKPKDFPENFSHHPVHILMDLMEQRQLNKNTLQALTDDIRSQPEIIQTRSGPKKVFPYTKFVGFGHPKMKHQLMNGGSGLDTTAGNLRKKVTERLAQVNMQKLLDYNIGDLRASILDPDIATDPKGYMGRNFIKAKPNSALMQSMHSAYDTDYGGTYAGGFGKNRPIELLQPDVYETVEKEIKARPVKKVKSDADYRAQVIGAIEKRKEAIAQPINARVINNAGLYEEGLKQGEFDPKNLDSVLAYFKRKGGYKKGGKVKFHSDMDTINLELSNKRKKAK
jgi:hypothetical protein